MQVGTVAVKNQFSQGADRWISRGRRHEIEAWVQMGKRKKEWKEDEVTGHGLWRGSSPLDDEQKQQGAADGQVADTANSNSRWFRKKERLQSPTRELISTTRQPRWREGPNA